MLPIPVSATCHLVLSQTSLVLLLVKIWEDLKVLLLLPLPSENLIYF